MPCLCKTTLVTSVVSCFMANEIAGWRRTPTSPIDSNLPLVSGGSLIAKDMVLTAAHCQGGSYKVVIGRHNLNSKSGESISMRREIPYPEYNSKNTDGDWMIILLDSSTTQNVPLIKLNMDASKPSPQSEVTVSEYLILLSYICTTCNFIIYYTDSHIFTSHFS